MIAFLEGIVVTGGTDAVVSVGSGIGLDVHLSTAAAAELPAPGEPVRLWTHLVVREDAWSLYGFLDPSERGMFRLLQTVSGIGPKTFEQCAGFLRIQGGANPLDASAVHPESYALVQKIIERAKKPLSELLGNGAALKAVPANAFVADGVGEITVRDVLAELEKPGRDPRPEFKVARFNEGVHDIKDLVEGMILEGTVTNVAAFGAFVDVGAHQDGLVHVSQLANKFVKDPKDVVKAGQIVKVKVVEVDVARKRIALTMKLDAEVRPRGDHEPQRHGAGSRDRAWQGAPHRGAPRAPDGAMAAAFAALKPQ